MALPYDFNTRRKILLEDNAEITFNEATRMAWGDCGGDEMVSIMKSAKARWAKMNEAERSEFVRRREMVNRPADLSVEQDREAN